MNFFLQMRMQYFILILNDMIYLERWAIEESIDNFIVLMIVFFRPIVEKVSSKGRYVASGCLPNLLHLNLRCNRLKIFDPADIVPVSVFFNVFFTSISLACRF